MLVQQVQEPIAKGQYQTSAFQSAENLTFENFSPGPIFLHGGTYSGLWMPTNV